ncbi:MAG: hypothetical protein U5K76_11745 [Woeseiaceae bacterium]|nr:hypothetical protein [Woeseiaceae bacterium]
MTGSHRDPSWSRDVDSLVGDIEAAIEEQVGDASLADLLDRSVEDDKDDEAASPAPA